MQAAGPVSFAEPFGQGWAQIGDLGVALGLSAAIGFEREVRQKSAGLRTHTLVGLGAALFMLVSKYGFTDVLVPQRVVVDPSRVAAQIVTGIGFIGGGLIFVRRDAVRGLTTAAVVWLTAAVGAAAGAGLPVLAVVATAAHFAVVLGFPPLLRAVTRVGTGAEIRLRYRQGTGVLRAVVAAATGQGYAVSQLATEVVDDAGGRGEGPGSGAMVEVRMRVNGGGPLEALTATLSELEGVATVQVTGDEGA